MDDAKEGFSVVKIGLGSLLVLALIGIVFAIFMLGSNKVNSTTNDLSNTMDSAELMQYAAYDNTEVKGSDVLTAVKNYQTQNIKIYVATKAGNGATPYSATDLSNGTGISGSVYTYGYMGVQGSSDTAPTLNAESGAWEASIVPGSAGSETFNKNFTPLTDKNSTETYVSQSGRFWSYLVYDTSTGEMSGILFVQTK